VISENSAMHHVIDVVLFKMIKEQIHVVLESVREIEARRQGVYAMNDKERRAVREGLEQARRGEFVPDAEMDAFWKKIGVL
jgi:hypothetical protein